MLKSQVYIPSCPLLEVYAAAENCPTTHPEQATYSPILVPNWALQPCILALDPKPHKLPAVTLITTFKQTTGRGLKCNPQSRFTAIYAGLAHVNRTGWVGHAWESPSWAASGMKEDVLYKSSLSFKNRISQQRRVHRNPRHVFTFVKPRMFVPRNTFCK